MVDRLTHLHRHFVPGQLHVPDFVVFLDDVDDRPPRRSASGAPRQPLARRAAPHFAPPAPMPAAFPSAPRIAYPPSAVYSPLHDEDAALHGVAPQLATQHK